VARDLVAALGVAGRAGALPAPTFLTAHRWRYARAVAPLADPCLADATATIGAAGDWCAPAREPGDPGALQAGAGVPEALHSGRALARVLLAG
jgi:predicted NAD/FAD-dependent oxidoreductase